MAAKKRESAWQRRARMAEKNLDRMTQAYKDLQAVANTAQESRDRYAKDLMQERNMNRELREQLAKAQEEIVRKDQSLQLVLLQARQAEAQLRAQLLTERARVDRMEKFQQLFQTAPQSRTPQTAPQTCRCSEHEERLRALLERVVSLESRMDAVSAASRPRRIFEGGG